MKKVLAMFLTVALLVNLIPTQTFAFEKVDKGAQTDFKSGDEGNEATIVGECSDKREECLKTFRLDDGSYLVCQYAEPVHYYDEGKWKEINNTLEDTDAETVGNTSNDVMIKFAKKAKKNNMVRVKQDDYVVSWGVLDAEKKAAFVVVENKKEDDKLTTPTSLEGIEATGIYENVFQNVDIRYTIVSKAIKEDIILKNKDVQNEFTFQYHLNGMEMQLLENKEIEFYDKETGESLYVMERPFMYDSSDEQVCSENVTLALSGENGKYTLTIVADKTWLNDKNREYPVVIDPSIQPVTNAYNIKDSTGVVNGNMSASNRATMESGSEKLSMKVGKRFDSELQGLIHFSIPSVIPSSARIIDARVALYFYERSSTPIQVNAHMITSDWNTSVIDVNRVLFGSEIPSYDNTVVDYHVFNSSSAYGYYEFDITSAVQKWNTGLAPNYGILLATETIPLGTSYVRFFESDHDGNYDPQYLFTYRDNKGLEDYWTYHTQNVGKAGTGYVSDYTGNLVFVHNDVRGKNDVINVVIDHVYDQSKVVDTETYLNSTEPKYGNGWTLNVRQKVYYISDAVLGKDCSFCYIDADGTDHYFRWDEEVGFFTDEDGLGMILDNGGHELNGYAGNESAIYRLSFKDETVLFFDFDGNLMRIEDKQGNTVDIHYNGEFVREVIGCSGRAFMEYDGNSRLVSIEDKNWRSMYYEYNEYGQLTAITQRDGSKTLYRYDERGYLTYVQNIAVDGGRYTMEYELYDYAPYRVKVIREYGTDGTVGQSIENIVYDHNQTTFTDNKGRSATYQFDERGCTTSVINALGNAYNYSYYDSGNKNYKISSAGDTQRSIHNYVLNSSGEYDTDWMTETAGTGVAYWSTDEAYVGSRSFCVSTQGEDAFYKQNLTLPAGYYTLSAYVKTNQVANQLEGGTLLKISYRDAGYELSWIESKCVAGTSEWKRLTATVWLENEVNDITIYMGMKSASGTSYFDCVQLEMGTVPNNYNMIQNGSFEIATGIVPSYWTASGTNTLDGIVSGVEMVNGDKSFKLTGQSDTQKKITQVVQVQGYEGDVFAVGVWVKASSVALREERSFAIRTRVIYADGDDVEKVHSLNPCVEDWQYLSVLISTDDADSTTQKVYTGVEVSFCYSNNANVAYVDHFQVTRDLMQSYVYDDEGNLVSTAELAEIESTFQYHNDLLSELVSPDGSGYEYSYTDKDYLEIARSSGGIAYRFAYHSLSSYRDRAISQVSGDRYASTVSIGKTYYIRNWHFGKQMKAENNVNTIGTTIIPGSPETNRYNRFTVVDAGSGYVYFELADGSGRRMSIRNATASWGQRLELNEGSGDAFKFKIVYSGDGMHYSIRPKLNESLAVCINIGDAPSDNILFLYGYNDAGKDKDWVFVETSQSEYMEPVADNVYFVTNHMTSQYFTLEGYQSQTGTTLKQYQFQGGENQQFKLEAFGEYFYLVPIYCDNMALAVNAEGTGVVLQPKSVIDMSQQFGIRSQLNGAYRIIPRLDASKSIAQMSENVSVYEGLSVCDYTGEPWQEWRFTMPDDYTVSDAPESGEIYYLHFNHSYRYLTVANEENASVKQETFDSGLDQQFQLKQTTDGYYHIYPMNTTKDMVLSVVPNASRTDGGGELKLQMKTDSAYQEFKFIETPNSTYRMVCRASATEDYCVELTSGSQSTNEEVTYAPFSGTGTANQWLTLEKIGPVIRTSTDYKKGKTNVENIIDEAGYITYMEEFQDGSPAIVRDAKGNWTEHYYSCEKDTLIYASSGSSMVNYSYDEDYALSHIDSASGTTYEFNYDAYRNIQTVAVGSRVLMNYSYENNNGVETSSTYGNGVGNWYMYDLYDRVDYVVYNINSQQGSREVLYDYDAFGRLYRTWDKYRDVYTINEYDFIGRPVRTETTDGLEQTYQYDSQNRITSYSTRVGANSLTTGFVYGDSSVYGNNLQKDGYLYGVTLNGERAISYEFDALSRLVAQRLEAANNYKVQYEYYKGPNNEGTAKTTTMLESVVNGDTRWTYTYDEVGNITSVSKNGTVVESYTYDNLNQLKTVTRGTDVWEYSYDNGGNLIEVKKNGSVIKTYAYGDSEWKDLLTAYNGQNLTYDEIGNPLQYRDGMSFIWQNGRKLATVTKGIDNIQYDYDSDGYRVSKIVNGVETTFYWLNGMLLGQECEDEIILFLYDDSGIPYGMCVKHGTTEVYYYYLYNAQGDIIGIIDSNGIQVVEYTYSAWGELLSVTGSMADSIGQKNPLRYRGYYYDGETGFYYLLSRYYDPEMSRFINADIYISTGQGILGNNMFVYCGNNSVTFVDECGTRYCEATTVINEKGYNRTMACKFQTRVVLEEMDVVVDITQKLNDFMEANVAKLEEYWSEHTTYETCWYFYENVKDGGTLDIKTQEEWKFEKGKKYIYNGMELRFDDPGNINFGYVGFTLFPKVLLCAGAGVNQIFKFAFQFGDVFSFYDDPRDNYMIRYGYDLRRSGF